MHRRFVVLVLAASLLLASCGGDDGGEETTPEDATTTGASAIGGADGSTTQPAEVVGPPTTRGPAPTVSVEPVGALGGMTVLSGEPLYRGVLGQIDPERNIVAPVALPPATAAAGIAPLTGLAVADPSVLERPAMIVKIDNTNKGRPQEALAAADMIYEEMIEGGFTRLAVVYHSQAPEVVGPVRSGRTTDIALIESLNVPVFVWSGANLVHASLLRRHDMVDLGAQSRSEYSRAADRPGTYNLMTDAVELYELAAGRENGGTPSPHFEYRDETIGLPDTAEPAAGVTVSFPSVTAEWAWDEDLAGWVRAQDGTPHIDAQDVPVVAANVVVAEVRQVRTGSVDTAGSPVFEQQFVGSGRGWVFTDGHVIEVTWTKPSLRSVATWTTADGVPVALTPGLTWIELAPEDGVTLSEVL
ncbi:MAG: hypothetical protein ACI9C1_002343 [Candidatus Aldehydirespiratoraceae bacterium]|jgi:hypothetical protein